MKNIKHSLKDLFISHKADGGSKKYKHFLQGIILQRPEKTYGYSDENAAIGKFLSWHITQKQHKKKETKRGGRGEKGSGKRKGSGLVLNSEPS